MQVITVKPKYNKKKILYPIKSNKNDDNEINDVPEAKHKIVKENI
jgi:hypothetical protein